MRLTQPAMTTRDAAPRLATQALQLAAEALLALADTCPDEEARPDLCYGCSVLAARAFELSELAEELRCDRAPAAAG